MPSLKRDWTVADVHALPEDGKRYEVIDGELFVTPAPPLRHQDAAARLYLILAEYLKPFLERELLEARLDELHTLSDFGKREREILDSLHRKLRESSDRIQHTEPL